MLSEEKQRLENFEKMYHAVNLGLEDATNQMAQLRAKGKQKSATYKQLMVQKLTYKNMLEMYKLFGIQ